jgi:hypothetical protein
VHVVDVLFAGDVVGVQVGGAVVEKDDDGVGQQREVGDAAVC